MSTIIQSWGSSSALTITLAGLASDTSLLAGRQSSVVDVAAASPGVLDYLIAGRVTTGTSPTDLKEIRIYLFGSLDDTPTYPAGMGAADAGVTVVSSNVRDSGLILLKSISTGATSDRGHPFGPVGVREMFGGVLPKRFGVFCVHNTGVNLNATAGNHFISVTPVYMTVSA